MIQGRRREFGVSGRLYKDNLLFFDRETDSLWSQLLSQAVTGPHAGTRLAVLPAVNTTWGTWRKDHPDTLVLSFDTGHEPDYRVDPYAATVIGHEPALLVEAGEVVKVFPFSELNKSPSPLAAQFGSEVVKVHFNRRSKTACAEGSNATSFVSYLEPLKAFFPEAQVYRAPEGTDSSVPK